MTDSAGTTLPEALAKYAIALPQEQVERLERYCHMLWDWNSKFNLTRHTDFDKFVARDLIDSMELAKVIQPGEDVLDVGSGGGVPGIALAILRPDVQVSLSESVGKKAQALAHMIESLDLPLGLHPCRAEEVLRDLRFHSLTARAVGPLERMLRWFQPHWLSMDRLLIVKGPRWREEQSEAQQAGLFKKLTLTVLSEYPMPGTESQSAVLEVKQITSRAQ